MTLEIRPHRSPLHRIKGIFREFEFFFTRRDRRTHDLIGVVPEGASSYVVTGDGGNIYDIHNYRERPGHTPGARVTQIRLKGIEGTILNLSPETPSGIINGDKFTYKPKPPARNPINQ